ncbi:replication protein A 70 kDa DNA-binding subunit B [Tanacetum coccineum]
MGYQKTPTLSSNNYKKNAGVGGSGHFGGSSGLSSNTYKQKTSVGASNSARYGGSSSLSTNGYKGRSNGYGGSKIVGSVGGSGGNYKEKKNTPISEVDPMLNDITIQGRCISIWHSHRLNAAHDPYSLDLVLQDVHNTRIHVYIKKEFMFRFEPLFEEGQCYILSNFGIAENSGRLPLLPHRYKISFYKCTTVTRIEPFDTNTNGFILEPFNHLLDPEHHEYYENDVVDVIGSVVGIGDIVPVMSAAGKKIRRTIVAEDVDGNHLDFTFWDTWASMWDQYANKRIPAIHNALFGTKIFINRNIPEIVAFKKRVQERDGYDANQVKIELFSPEVKVVSIAEFFHSAINRMVGDIRDSEPESSDELAESTKKNKGMKEDSSDEQESEMHTTSKTKKKQAIIKDDKNISEDSSDEHVFDMHTCSMKKYKHGQAFRGKSSVQSMIRISTPTKTKEINS